MMTHGSPMRVIAVMLAVVLVMTFAAPARAEAIDPMTWVAIAGAAVVVIILIAYIIVASSKGPRMPDARDESMPVMVACAEAEGQPRSCWVVDRPAERVNPDEIVPVSEPVGLDALTLAPQS
jgi:hypothetical protein